MFVETAKQKAAVTTGHTEQPTTVGAGPSLPPLPSRMCCVMCLVSATTAVPVQPRGAIEIGYLPLPGPPPFLPLTAAPISTGQNHRFAVTSTLHHSAYCALLGYLPAPRPQPPKAKGKKARAINRVKLDCKPSHTYTHSSSHSHSDKETSLETTRISSHPPLAAASSLHPRGKSEQANCAEQARQGKAR